MPLFNFVIILIFLFINIQIFYKTHSLQHKNNNSLKTKINTIKGMRIDRIIPHVQNSIRDSYRKESSKGKMSQFKTTFTFLKKRKSNKRSKRQAITVTQSIDGTTTTTFNITPLIYRLLFEIGGPILTRGLSMTTGIDFSFLNG